ncbi:MAG TPA: hypothetical protein DCG33_06205 [Prevotellaceae bacterium]|nr:hypothetical protein [Prevotellaceae bacterium]
MKAAYRTLYEKYNTILKPLISEQEGRLETFAVPLLESLSCMLDAVSLADACDNDVQKSKYVKVADEALNLSISYSYQYLIYALQKEIDTFEERAPKSVRNRIDGGKFWKQYVDHKQAAVLCEVEAKKQESLNPALSVDKYQEAYLHYVEIDKMFNTFAAELKDSQWHKKVSTCMKGWHWLWVTIWVAVITAVLRFMISYYSS